MFAILMKLYWLTVVQILLNKKAKNPLKELEESQQP